MARHHMTGTADRSTHVMLISRCSRFLYVTLPVCEADPRASSTNAPFETKEEGGRKRRERIQRDYSDEERSDELTALERSSERARSSSLRFYGKRFDNRQVSNCCALEKASGNPLHSVPGTESSFFLPGRGGRRKGMVKVW